MSDNIKVVVKVRPLISREIEDKLTYQWRVKNDTLYQIDQNGKDTGTCFTFDKVYDKDTDTSEVYNDVAKPIVEAAITGFNGTIFAYGQTSSGKTYTMSGTENSPGIIPRAVIHLFDRIKQSAERDFLVRVSYIEIYNETLRDLLNIEKKPVKIHETLHGVKVDADERITSTPEEVLEAMREGEANRQTGATNMNEESSRSHSIFQITIASREHMEDEEEVGCVNVSQLNLVDLAGSERSGQTGATGIRFKEGTHINKSLSVLARVIKQLSEAGPNHSKYINYRDSKLTRILQNSLGGNAKTSIICAVTPASVEETISTLQFANRAKAIQNKPEVNAVASNATTNTAMIQSLTKQLSKLQAQLEDKRNLEQDNANLQNKISNLQKWILNGFVQNSSMDATVQSRRKMQQARRVTISTLHPIAEDASPPVPKFCTPSLKYNSLLLSTSSEFLPIQNASKTSLGPVPEESDRMVTPPLVGGKRVGEGDIINLDDSDDIGSEVKTCSPYHKCYARTRTPPCVLRNNALAAEKSLQEIIDLTKREKMYTPNTVEMLEKLEENCVTISKLEEELATLKEQSKEKDTQISELQQKIAKTEEEVNTLAKDKVALENQCKDFSVKLTDWEVSYETLKNKTRRREEELLLLLDEEKSKKPEDIPRSVSRELNFMDVSKDISLVNSDTEVSIIANPIEMESSEQIKELVTELQNQLSVKNNAISTLESNLDLEKQRIESLELSVQDLQAVIDDFNTKYPQLETENSYLKSTIETLNSTIENQKLCLEAINKDMQSYNMTIQELQIKLSTKETLPHIKLNDNQLEAMITNEEKFIANNENMKNIVKSFKLLLDSRNKEIDALKSRLKDSAETKSRIKTLKDDIEIKEKHIITLMEQVEKLKDQLNENVDVINKLMANEIELNTKFVDAEDQIDVLKKQNVETSGQASTLQEKNEELTDIVQELYRKIDDAQNQWTKKSEESRTQARDLNEVNIKLTGVIDQLSTDILKLQEQNESLLKQNEELIAQNKYLEDLNVKLKNTITEKEALEQEIKSKQNILSHEYDTMTQKITDLEKEVNLNHEEIKNLTGVIDNLNTDILKLQDQNESLLKQNEELIAQNKYLEDLNVKLKNTVTEKEALEQEIKSKQNIISHEYGTMTEKITDLEKEVNLNHEEMKNLTGVIDKLNKDILNVQDQNESLLKQNEELIAQNKYLEDLNVKLENTVTEKEALEQEIKSKQNIISHEYGTMTEKITDLEKEVNLNHEEMKNLTGVIDKLNKDILNVQDQNESLLKQNEVLIAQNKYLEDLNVKLENTVTEKEALEQEIKSKQNILSHEYDTMTQKIIDLEKEVNLNHEEMKNLTGVIDKLNKDILNVQDQNDSLKKRNEESVAHNKYLEDFIAKLKNTVAEKETFEQEITSKHNILSQEYDYMAQKINDLEKEVNLKQEEMKRFSDFDRQSEEYLVKFKLVLNKVQDILFLLNNKKWVVPEHVDSFETVGIVLNDGIQHLQIVSKQLLEERNHAIENYEKITQEISVLKEKYNADISSFHGEMEIIKKREEEIEKQNEELLVQIHSLETNNNIVQNQIETKNHHIVLLESQLNEIKQYNEDLRNDHLAIENTLKENIESLKTEIKLLSLSEEKATSDLQQNIADLTKLVNEKQDEFEEIIKNKDEAISKLKCRLVEVEKALDTKYQDLAVEKDNNDLKQNLVDLVQQMQEKQEEYDKLSKIKEESILELNCKLVEVEKDLDKKRQEVTNIMLEVSLAKESKITILANLFDKVSTLLSYLNIEHDSPTISDGDGEYLYKEIIFALDKLSLCISADTNKHEVEFEYQSNHIQNELVHTVKEMPELPERNVHLLHESAAINRESQEILPVTPVEDLNESSSDTNHLLHLKSELDAKCNELLMMEKETMQWKDRFMVVQSSMQQQIMQLQLENKHLRDLEGTAQHIEKKSPPSLLTICYSHIIDAMQMNNKLNYASSTSSKSSIASQDAQAQVNCCECTDMTQKLNIMMDDNVKLMETIKQLESANETLLSEQEEIRGEIQLLTEPAQQLQKKLVNHRSNLSTLMATTYAENKLLQSQLKVMKHHHTRYINLVQKELPYFKAQLSELMMLLKDNESYVNRHNVSFKRYSLPDILHENSPLENLKDDSTLDGDLLMMDTNVTLASAESTLLSYDQTCLDITQMNLDDELAETSKAIDLFTQTEWLKSYDKKLLETVKNLKLENQELKEQVAADTLNSDSSLQKVQSVEPSIESTYRERLSKAINHLEQELESMRLQKDEIEKKYTELTLEIPTTETLVKTITSLEEDNQKKVMHISKITNDLSKKTELVKELQEENDQLSTQVMESISEVDDLKEELESMKALISKYKEIEAETEVRSKTTYAKVTDPLLKLDNSLCNSDRKLNRSHSDSESTSRLYKICTIQNEILESKQDRKNISEDGVTVKNSMERSNFNMSIQLDDSMSDKNIFNFTKDIEANKEACKIKTSEMEKSASDLYTVDRIECLKYYIEKTGDEKENLGSDFKLIDVMKSFYNNLISKHSEEVENFNNKLRDFEESKVQLEAQINDLSVECEKLTKEMYVKDSRMQSVDEVLTNIRTSTDFIRENMYHMEGEDSNKKIQTMFNDNLLRVLEKEFHISSCDIFQSLINNIACKHQKYLADIMNRYAAIQAHVVSLEAEINDVNQNLIEVKAQLAGKELENDLLKAQKDKIQEISNAVTLDIVQKDREIYQLLKTGYEQLVECNVVVEIDLKQPVDVSINLLFQKVKELQKQNNSNSNNEKQYLAMEVKKLGESLEQKDLELASLKNELFDKEEALLTQISKNEDLNKAYVKNMENIYLPLKQFETTTNEKMQEVINKISDKEQVIMSLQNKIKQINVDEKPKITEILHKVEELIKENESLKSINTIISDEKKQVDVELQISQELINKNKVELDKLTADILILRETVADNMSVIESLTNEAKVLHERNQLLKMTAEDKSQECSRLEMSIKTHEKTTEIQTRMISRLKKHQEDTDEAMKDKNKQLDELTQKCLDLQKEYELVSQSIVASREEVERLKADKKHLEVRVLQLETEMEEGHKRRSIDAICDNARRRRQSLHDSKRLTDCDKLEFADHNKMEAVFETRAKPDDLFMDVDCDSGHSNRSTPLRLSRGRDSMAKQDSDDDPPSRPSSVMATKLRRQSIHDSHRNALSHTPSPHDHPRIVEAESNDNNDAVSTNIHERLAATEKELEELKEKYRELDEECEICAQYLQERDAQCAVLKKEKKELEQHVSELNARLKANPNGVHSQGDIKVQFSDASVNTDEDWANLHSVVVDRMSYDAEVEKNKKLLRTVEELRYKNQDLKKTLQKLMEKHSSTKDIRELELAKSELNACKEELEELKERYRELDEECETCAEYLKERDEQCRKLKEAKAALEAKLLEYEEENVSNVAQSVKKRRQTVHDQNRTPTTDYTDATTETSEEMSSYRFERNGDSRNESADAMQTWETKYKQVRHTLDKVIMEKTALEHKLMAFHPTTYVATGSAIVQSQQLTDVMRENQKLKRINAKLVEMCKKRGKSQEARSRDTRENENPGQQ